MRVIVKGMEMPKNCQECALYIDGACYGKGYRDYRSIMDTAKPDDCPLIELPPHGRLIDADKLLEKAYWDYNEATHDYNNIKVVSEYDIDDAPTVIEAEGSEA